MTQVRRVLVFVLVGAILGDIVATMIAPGLISWWNTPGAGGTQMICDAALLHRAINSLITAQLIGAGVGAGVFLIVGVIITGAMARRAQRKAAAAPAQ